MPPSKLQVISLAEFLICRNKFEGAKRTASYIPAFMTQRCTGHPKRLTLSETNLQRLEFPTALCVRNFDQKLE